MEEILISVENISVAAELNDSPTARLILDSLPLEGKARVWGEEIYFIIPLEVGLEREARVDVEVGELGYWPSGPAFCIFFGPTPVSTSEKPRAYSPVNVFGRVLDDCSPFKAVPDNAKIRVERKDQ